MKAHKKGFEMSYKSFDYLVHSVSYMYIFDKVIHNFSIKVNYLSYSVIIMSCTCNLTTFS